MHYKQNNKESKTYVQGLRPFGNTLPRGVRSILKKNGYNYSEIINKWNFLVGKELANCCYPKSIKMDKKNSIGMLILAVKRGDEINVEYAKKKIINKINSYFGYKLLNEIRLQGYSKMNEKVKSKNNYHKINKKFEKKINEIKSTNIKNSLTQLLKVIKND